MVYNTEWLPNKPSCDCIDSVVIETLTWGNKLNKQNELLIFLLATKFAAKEEKDVETSYCYFLPKNFKLEW